MTTILAIDPGPKSSHVLRFRSGSVLYSEHMENDSLIRDTWIVNDDTIAIEMIACYGMPVGAEVFETCYFIGRLLQVCDQLKLTVMRVYRKDVKMELCQSPRAKDANVRQALIDILGAPGTKKNPGPTYGVSGHAWAALAVAWYAAKRLESSTQSAS
jgi:hypothetical protein